MRERAREVKAAARRGPHAGNADGERDVLAKIAEMPELDRAMWPNGYALKELTADVEATIVALLKNAVS